MTLKPVGPFNYGTYLANISDFPEWMTDYVQGNTVHGITGWLDHFKSYKYTSGRGCWLIGVKDRYKYHKRLMAAVSGSNNQNLVSIANLILHWGGIKNADYQIQHAPGIRQALGMLQNESLFTSASIQNFCSFTTRHRIASHSKIYEMFDPHKWAIYDSRVATALVCLVSQFWKQKGQIASNFLTFDVPPRNKANCTRPYPHIFIKPLYGNKKSQASFSFVYCSWLLRRVAEILRTDHKYGCPPTIAHANNIAPLDGHWQVYHVEMALWMMGDKQF